MNLEEAIREVKYLLEAIEPPSCDPDEIGYIADQAEEELRYLVTYAEVMRTTPTTHDSKAEMDDWDKFFEEIANGQS